MLNKSVVTLLLACAVLLAGCKKELRTDQLAPGVNPSQSYYTQFSLFQEKNNFRTTNYRKGILIPINTPVQLLSINSAEAVLKRVDSGQTLTVENVPKHTQDDMQTAFQKIAKPDKVDLSRFSAAEQAGILAGQALKGMNRQAVLAALSYPPTTETATLQADAWTYWANRFNRFVVYFKDGKVERIVD